MAVSSCGYFRHRHSASFRMTRLPEFVPAAEELVQADNKSTTHVRRDRFPFSRPILTLRQLETALIFPYMAAKRYVDKLVGGRCSQGNHRVRAQPGLHGV